LRNPLPTSNGNSAGRARSRRHTAARRRPGEVAARRSSRMRPAPPRRAHPHPPAGGRGDGPRAAGAGNWPAASACAKRVMATRPRRLRPSGRYPPRTCVTGVQAARRHPGEVGARRLCGMTGTGRWSATHRPDPRKPWIRRPPPRAHPHPRAGGRGDGRRAAGAGNWPPASGCARGAPRAPRRGET
jgi:hypothetical protein